MAKTRIFFATDLHGSEKCFKKFINAGRFYKVNVLIIGGDITGKMLVPIVKYSDGTVRARFFGRDRVARNSRETEELMKIIKSAGFYPYLTKPQEMKEFEDDPEKVKKLFSELTVETLRRWVKLAEERLKGSGIKCYIQPGNDDIFEIDTLLEQSDYIVNPEGKIVWINGHHEMISTGHANLTPWNCPRDLSEEELAKKINGMTFQVERMENCIFNFHCPPYGSQLDVAPELDENLTVVMRRGEVSMVSVGSIAVRDAIKRYQPLLGLHGHIHESRGVYRIGRTLSINPGSEYTEGILRGVIVQLEESGFKSYQLTSG